MIGQFPDRYYCNECGHYFYVNSESSEGSPIVECPCGSTDTEPISVQEDMNYYTFGRGYEYVEVDKDDDDFFF